MMFQFVVDRNRKTNSIFYMLTKCDIYKIFTIPTNLELNKNLQVKELLFE